MRPARMIPIAPILAALALGLAAALPTDATAGQFSGGIRFGFVLGDPGPFVKPHHRPHRFAVQRDRVVTGRKSVRRHGHGHGLGHKPRNRFHPFFIFPHYGYAWGSDSDRRQAYVPPPSPPPPSLPPEPPVVEEPAAAPDPRGPRRVPARGAAPVEPPYAVGEALPANLPHVTLDWRLYDLPEPPVGRVYARVGRDVLLITADERVVEKVVEL